MEFKSISIKSFISDLPRVFNENFKKVADFIDTIYESGKEKLKAKELEIKGQTTTNTLKANNAEIKSVRGNKIEIQHKESDGTISLLDLYDEIADLKRRITDLENNQ